MLVACTCRMLVRSPLKWRDYLNRRSCSIRVNWYPRSCDGLWDQNAEKKKLRTKEAWRKSSASQASQNAHSWQLANSYPRPQVPPIISMRCLSPRHTPGARKFCWFSKTPARIQHRREAGLAALASPFRLAMLHPLFRAGQPATGFLLI